MPNMPFVSKSRAIHLDARTALNHAITTSLDTKAADGDVKVSWDVVHAACAATQSDLVHALSNRSVLKDLLDGGQLKRLGYASRYIRDSCGGLKPGSVSGARHKYITFGDVQGPKKSGARLGTPVGLTGSGVLHSDHWTAAGRFQGFTLMGDLTCHTDTTVKHFHGEAKIDPDLQAWTLVNGTLDHTLGYSDQGKFQHWKISAGTRFWQDGTSVAMDPSKGAYHIAPWQCGDRHGAPYLGEGTLTWSDGVVHQGIFQNRAAIFDEAPTKVHYILTERDYTTVYFSVGDDLKPELNSRVVAKLPTAAPTPAANIPQMAVSSANLMDI